MSESEDKRGPLRGYEVIAEYYDTIPLYANRADVDFYVECAKEAGRPVLELGCGTGRILIPTAAAGCEITGLDISEAMLNRCRERLAGQPKEVQKRARLVQGSMVEFAVGGEFKLVTVPFRGFQHLVTVEEQAGCLRSAQRHLAPDGRLVLDVFHPNPPMLHDPAFMKETDEFPEVELPDGRRFRRTWRVVAFRRREQINEVEFAFYVTHADGRQERFVEQFPMRYFFRYELEHLLANCGFRVEALYGDFDKSPLKEDSPEMILVARRAV
jgi:SAM-dependent methyltransferase